MTAKYPAKIKTWIPVQDEVDLAKADDVNTSYEEITAIQQTLGINPADDQPTVSERILNHQTNLHSWLISKNPSRIIGLNISGRPVMPDCSCHWWFEIAVGKKLYWDDFSNKLLIQ